MDEKFHRNFWVLIYITMDAMFHDLKKICLRTFIHPMTMT